MALLLAGPAAASFSEYDALIREALVEHNAGNWEEARHLFQKAHAIRPNARTWRALGMTSFELKRYAEAIVELEHALVDPSKPLAEQQRESVLRILERARDFVARYELAVPSGVTEVVVNGRVVPLSEDRILLLDPGEHVLRIQASGASPVERHVVAKVGARERLVFEEKPATDASADTLPGLADRSAIDQGADDAARGSLFWTWVAAGSAGVFGAGGVTLGLLAADQHRSFESLQAPCPACDDAAIDAARRNGQRFQVMANVALTLAGLAAASAVALFFVESSQPAHQASVSVGVGAGSFVIQGTL